MDKVWEDKKKARNNRAIESNKSTLLSLINSHYIVEQFISVKRACPACSVV
jgi:hypothetical protein